jgi:hypothetical protein
MASSKKSPPSMPLNPRRTPSRILCMTKKCLSIYALFLDMRKAFDTVDRQFIFQKLIDTRRLSYTELNFLAHTLDLIFLQSYDGVSISHLIVQSNGVRQGGCTSPFLFNFSISDINEIIRHFNSVKAIFYADDIVLLSENLIDLKEALQLLNESETKEIAAESG